MVDKTTPRLGLPVPYLTNPLKIDVGKLTDALTMLDANAVMLTDWDITVDDWQKMGTITNLAQGKIAITLMVVTGTGFANIVMQTGDGSVTTVGDPARITVTAQTNLGPNSATILGGKLVETAKDTYEIWFNVAPSTAPRKWTGLLIAGNGATIDWTHASGAQPSGGVNLAIARSLTDQEIASPTVTRDGAVLTSAYAGLMGIKLPYFDFAATGDTITSHIWRVGETMRVKAADATGANGFPSGVTGAGASGWRIHCEGINEDRTSTVFTFGSEGATPTWLYRVTRSGNSWSTPRRMYTSDNPPAASETKAVAQMDAITTVINLNDRVLPAHYGIVSLTSAAGAVAANNFPFDEVGQLAVFPFGTSGGVTQVYIAKSGRIASRSYDGSTFTNWRKGAVSGANDDITSMTALSGPLKLGGDGIADYDAVTVRQLRASSGGSGPTMNGVVNNFIGAVEWWNGSPTKLPAGYVLANGQPLSRVANKEVSDAIDSGIFTSVTEALWQKDALNGVSNRAAYSQGGAAGTAPAGSGITDAWFRVPDLNGGQSGSIENLYLMGYSGRKINNIYSAGSSLTQGAPNLAGSFKARVPNGHANEGVGVFIGASNLQGLNGNIPVTYTGGTGADFSDPSGYGYSFDAQRGAQNYTGPGVGSAYKTYGAYSDGALRPNNAVGYWIVRVGASFQSANTNFSVIAGDATAPGANTTVLGGQVYSRYTIGGVNKISASLVASGQYNTTESAMVGMAVIQARNDVSNAFQNFIFDTNGDLTVPRYLLATNIKPWTGNRLDISALVTCNDLHTASGGGCGVRTQTIGADINDVELNNSPTQLNTGNWINWTKYGWYSGKVQTGAVRGSAKDISAYQITINQDPSLNQPVNKDWVFKADGTTISPLGQLQTVASDIALKDNPEKAAPGALSRIRKVVAREFDWKHDGRHDRGYIAQELQKIDPIYAYEVNGLLNVSQNALIADLIESVKTLADEVDRLKA